MARDKKSELVKKMSEHEKVQELVDNCVSCCMAFAVTERMENEDVFDAFMVIVHNRLMQLGADKVMIRQLENAKYIIDELDRLEKLIKDLNKSGE